MIFLITNKLDPHVDAVIEQLRQSEGEFVRFNTEDFPQKINFTWQIKRNGIEGELHFPLGRKIKLSQISSCWYRRPSSPIVSNNLLTSQTKGFAKDEAKSLLQGLWVYLSSCFWISNPFKIRVAENKMANLKIAASLGFYVPRTLITNDSVEAKNFFHSCQGNVINKVLGRGQVEYLRDYYFIYTHRVLPQDLARMNSVVYTSTLFQEYIPKKMEIRVTVVGDKVLSCEIHSQDSKKTTDDWRHYDLKSVKHVAHHLPEPIETLCLEMLKKLDLNFGTFDFILTPDDHYVFLELNPNGQWLWIEQLTGLPISKAIAELLINRK